MKILYREKARTCFGNLRIGDLFWHNKYLCVKTSFDSYFDFNRKVLCTDILPDIIFLQEEDYVLAHKLFLKEEFK